MFRNFMGPTFAGMRGYAKITEAELGKRVGKSARTIERLEKNDRKIAINRELEEAIVKATGVTKPIFADILAGASSDYLGVRFVVLPPDVVVPPIDVLMAIRLFARHGHKLGKREQLSIGRILNDLRGLSSEAERFPRSVARDIIERINDARRKLGEDVPDDED